MADTVTLSVVISDALTSRIKELESTVKRWELGWASAVQRVDECIGYLEQNQGHFPDEYCGQDLRRLRWVRDVVLVEHKPDKH